MALLELLQNALIISIFVAVMMLVVEYVNVWSRGSFSRLLKGSRLRQYVLASLLGATPGCLGGFVLVTLYTQRAISLGAVAAGMIASVGDEMFVLLALAPRTAIPMSAGLVVLGILTGWLTDTLVGRLTKTDPDDCCHFVEEHHAACDCYPREGVLSLWRPPRPERGLAVLALSSFVAALATGWIGPAEWDAERIGFLAVGVVGLVIVATASEEFFREHVWHHVAREHVPRLFLWTLGALAAIAAVEQFVDARSFVAENRWAVLLAASLIGVIPQSGPHLLFVTLYADGALPLSVLVANSAVQDGHGMLPLLAHSRRDFLVVKSINLLVGLAVGAVIMALGR
jgi:hypothetical protein